MTGNRFGCQKVAALTLGMSVDEYLSRRASGLKYCGNCRDWHGVAAFGPDATRPDGLRSSCRKSRWRKH